MLLDYHLPHGDGLQLCYRITSQVPAPKVVVFTAYASPTLSLPATLARRTRCSRRTCARPDLFEALRRVNRGERIVAPISRTVFVEASERVQERDRALLGVLLDGATESEAAATLRLEPKDVRHAVQRILSALRLDVPAARAG